MDRAEDDDGGGMVRSSGVMNTVQDQRKQTSFMEKLMGVKNSQCDLYLDRVHKELDQSKLRNIRTLHNETVKVQYDFKLLQVDIKRQEIQDKKRTDPKSDTSLDEVLVEKSAKYLQCNNVNPCYLDKTIGYPIRRSIKSDFVSPTVHRARKVLQEQSVDRQIERAQDDRKLQLQRSKSVQSRRSVHFQMDAQSHQPMEVENNTNTEEKSDKKSAKSACCGKSVSSSDSPAVNNKRPRTSFSAKATVISYPGADHTGGGNSTASTTMIRPLLNRSDTGVDGYKFLLLSERERSGLPGQQAKKKSPEGEYVDNTDVKQWAEQSALYNNHHQLLPNINNAKNNQDSLNNNNNTGGGGGGKKLNIVENAEDKNSFMKLITSWKSTPGHRSVSDRQSAHSHVSSSLTRRRSAGTAGRKSSITTTMLRQEQMQIHRRIQNFYRVLQDDKSREALAVAQREKELREKNMTLARDGESDGTDDDIKKAIWASQSLKLADGNELCAGVRSGKTAAKPLSPAKSIRARLRWQKAIRKVIDNLDTMMEEKLLDSFPCFVPGKTQQQTAELRFQGLAAKPRGGRGMGAPSHSLNRSKRHNATFKLQKVVQELLRNKNTFQRLEYEETKQKLLENGK